MHIAGAVAVVAVVDAGAGAGAGVVFAVFAAAAVAVANAPLCAAIQEMKALDRMTDNGDHSHNVHLP